MIDFLAQIGYISTLTNKKKTYGNARLQRNNREKIHRF